MLALYQLSEVYSALINAQERYAEENGGHINEGIEAQIVECKEHAPEILKDYKNHVAFSGMIQGEISALRGRMMEHDKKADRCKAVLEKMFSSGEKAEYDCGAVSWRRSKSVHVENENGLPEEAFKIFRDIRKDVVKNLINLGMVPPDVARIVERNNIQIK